MPIDIREFENAPETDLRATGEGTTNAERVLSFLSAHSEQAFTPKEVREATDIPRGSIGVVLSRLEERGLVRHRGDYWAIGDDADVDVALASTRVAQAAGERFGSENPDEWGPGVSDDAEDS